MNKNERLSGAIEVLQEELEGYARKISETKRMVNSLRASMGEPPLYTDTEQEHIASGAIRPDQFYGSPLATAAADYLRIRTRACTAAEIQAGLESGGFDFDALGWKEKDRLRALSMSLAKNTKTFHRLPNNGPFGLVVWYDAKTIAGSRRGGDEESEETETKEEPQKAAKAAKATEGSA